MRVDKKKNTVKVLKEVINNPLQSQRDIAKTTWISLGAVNSSIKELEQSWTLENFEIIDFVKEDLEIQKLATAEIKRRLTDEAKNINNQDIVRLNDSSFKRSFVLNQKSDPNKNITVTFEI